jgi:hypothetical protein
MSTNWSLQEMIEKMNLHLESYSGIIFSSHLILTLAKTDPASARKYLIDLFRQVSDLKTQFTERNSQAVISFVISPIPVLVEENPDIQTFQFFDQMTDRVVDKSCIEAHQFLLGKLLLHNRLRTECSGRIVLIF